MRRLETPAGEAWRELVEAPIALIVLAKSTCPVCRAWTEELSAFLETDRRWTELRVGRIFLYEEDDRSEEAADDEEEDGTPDAIARALSAATGPPGGFARANRDWLGEVQDLPHNVLYVRGERVKSWPGAGLDRLINRLEGIAG